MIASFRRCAVSYTLSPKHKFCLICREPYSDNIPLNVPRKYCRKAIIYELCVMDATVHVICCSGQNGWLEENPYDFCRNLWVEIGDFLSMGEHNGQLISASQEKYHVVHFLIFCCWDVGVGEVVCLVTFVRSLGALRSLSHDARVSASVSQFRENTPLILLFRLHQMREMEQKRNFAPPPQVSTGVMGPKFCWIPLLSVNFCIRHFTSIYVDAW